MVKCCIVGCTSGYKSNKEVVSQFCVPKDPLRNKWIKAISRLDFKISKNTYVCEKLFNEHEIVRYWISGSVKMEFLRAERMPVADHFLAVMLNDQQQQPPPPSGEVCETCLEYFADKAELWRHARDGHADDARLACPVAGCGRRFFARAMCAAHLAEHLTVAANTVTADDSWPHPLTCELCGRPTLNRAAYDRHTMAEHRDARAATCGWCHTYHGDAPSLAAHHRLTHAVDDATGSHGRRRRKRASADDSSCPIRRTRAKIV